MTQTVKCKYCGKSFSLDEAVAHGIEEKVRKQLAQEQELRVKQIEKEASEKAAQELERKHSLALAQKDKQLADLRKRSADLERKARQGSQETQGEVLEDELENLLDRNFKQDIVEAIKKGKLGADILQKVRNMRLVGCGSILWESKNANQWSNSWVSKLKMDMRNHGAQFGVLVTEVFPSGVNTKTFTQKEGIYITSVDHAVGLSSILRRWLVHIANERASQTTEHGEKLQAIHNYLTSTKFTHKVEALLEAEQAMREELESEKEVARRRWNKREKLISSFRETTGEIYVDLQELMGNALPEVRHLSLPAAEDAELDETDE